MSYFGRRFHECLETETGDVRSCPFGHRRDYFDFAERTAVMLGTGNSGYPFGIVGKIAKEFGYEKERVQAEYFRVDQIWFSEPNGDETKRVNEVYIEHECQIGLAHQEVRKLAHLGPGIKLLITYAYLKQPEVNQHVDALAVAYGYPATTPLELLIGGYAEVQGRMAWAGFQIQPGGLWHMTGEPDYWEVEPERDA